MKPGSGMQFFIVVGGSPRDDRCQIQIKNPRLLTVRDHFLDSLVGLIWFVLVLKHILSIKWATENALFLDYLPDIRVNFFGVKFGRENLFQ
jgi:hypothetical protein